MAKTINLNEEMTVDARTALRNNVVLYLSTFAEFHIGKPGGNTTQTKILTRIGTQWVVQAHIYAKTKTEAYGYAVALVFDAKRLATERREARQAVLDRQNAARREAKAKRPNFHIPRHTA